MPEPSTTDPTGRPAPDAGRKAADEVDLTVVVMGFVAADPAALQAVLGKYVVMGRGHPGCRNIDLLVSMTDPRRLTIITKWESPATQRAHFDSPEMVEMARACEGLLGAAPDIDLYAGISAHDLA
ncbi:MAG: antibiotic biosynthesis monooxygenase [Acidimicrobiia bacterium]|nr:antibiotic biosynthesis monooxygenase [Acidimicrobiia bacterium]